MPDDLDDAARGVTPIAENDWIVPRRPIVVQARIASRISDGTSWVYLRPA